jgi:bacterioferritin-associated ferredoxin
VAQPGARPVAIDAQKRPSLTPTAFYVHLLLRPIIILAISGFQENDMVVCVCNAIREKDLRAAVREGADSPCSAYAKFGRRPKCGQCVSFARTIIAAELATA